MGFVFKNGEYITSYHDGFIAARYGLDTSWLPKYENMSPDDIVNEMHDMLDSERMKDRYFDYDAWMWELSDDIRAKLRGADLFRCLCMSEVDTVFGIQVHPVHDKRNYIYLARKVKKVNVMNYFNISFDEWLQKLLPRCRAFADGAGYDFCYATFRDFRQVNVRIKNPRNGQWQSFDFDYFNVLDLDIDDCVKYVMDICKNALGDTKYDTRSRHCGYSAKMTFIDEIPPLKMAKTTFCMSKIKNVIFNDPATIVFWKDGTKTVVKAQDETFDPEKGLAMAISKKAMGNEGKYFNEFKKWLPEEETPASTAEALYCRGKETTTHVCDNCEYCETCSTKEPCKSCAGVTGSLFGPDNFVPKKTAVEWQHGEDARVPDPQALEDFFNDK